MKKMSGKRRRVRFQKLLLLNNGGAVALNKLRRNSLFCCSVIDYLIYQQFYVFKDRCEILKHLKTSQ